MSIAPRSYSPPPLTDWQAAALAAGSWEWLVPPLGYFTRAQAADYLYFSSPTVNELAAEGRLHALPATGGGPRRLITRASLLRFLASVQHAEPSHFETNLREFIRSVADREMLDWMRVGAFAEYQRAIEPFEWETRRYPLWLPTSQVQEFFKLTDYKLRAAAEGGRVESFAKQASAGSKRCLFSARSLFLHTLTTPKLRAKLEDEKRWIVQLMMSIQCPHVLLTIQEEIANKIGGEAA